MAESSPQPNLLTLTDDMLTHIASFLLATDLARLSIAAKRFTAPPTEGPAEGPGLLEQVAMRRVEGHTPAERAWVPRTTWLGEGVARGRGPRTWLALAFELEQLRRPLRCSRAHAALDLELSGGTVTRRATAGNEFRTAVSPVVMRAGQHYAQFTLVRGQPTVGLVASGYDPRGDDEFAPLRAGCESLSPTQQPQPLPAGCSLSKPREDGQELLLQLGRRQAIARPGELGGDGARQARRHDWPPPGARHSHSHKRLRVRGDDNLGGFSHD